MFESRSRKPGCVPKCFHRPEHCGFPQQEVKPAIAVRRHRVKRAFLLGATPTVIVRDGLGDKPEQGLVAGQVGTVVEVLAPGVFEVEFLDSHGRTFGLAELRRDELLALIHEPALAA
jgi:hypothetical protein